MKRELYTLNFIGEKLIFIIINSNFESVLSFLNARCGAGNQFDREVQNTLEKRPFICLS
jgi:hypothetical protein